MISPTDYQESTFSIPKMDCPSEENLIRMALSNAEGVQSLRFDLARRELKARHQGQPDSLLQLLQPLNLGASLVNSQPIEIDDGCRVSIFSVPKMDCTSEEHLIRMALQDATEVQSLTFDLNSRVIKVMHHGTPDALLKRLEPLKLGAVLRESEPVAAAQAAASDQGKDAAEARTLRLLLGINAVMFLIELATGLIAQSTSLIADSLDMFADAAVYGLALFVVGSTASMKSKAAHLAGWLQLLLAIGVLTEVIRRFIFGSEPESMLMMSMGVIAMIANVACLLLISGKREAGVHMKASYIFSANDVIANLGVIVAGVLVHFTGSPYPDLVIGTIIGVIVLNGARRILQLK